TAISAMMVLSNDLQKAGAPKAGVEVLAQLLHPFAPHLGEEMWSLLGREASIQKVEWPVADPKLLVDDEVEVPVQINGKKRGVLVLSKDADQDTAVAAAKADERLAELLAAGTLRKTVWVPGKILNFIVG
ncbi:MAG: class I tRNA ligase family protein, partial [Myxococcales bacterium]|nr:class I tRNA ligase family protein [Myxococcales bacterium]